MEYQTKHIGTLLGRIFLISSPLFLNHWNGANENSLGDSDYDSLDDYSNVCEINGFRKNNHSVISFFSMSSKIEIFKTAKSLILCDSLYFNKSWSNGDILDIEFIKKTNFTISITDNKIFIYDAVLAGDYIKNVNTEGTYNSFESLQFNDYSVVNIENGVYRVEKVIIKTIIGEETVHFDAVQIIN